MNDKYQEFYDYLKSENLTDLDSESFQSAYSQPEKFNELWGYISEQNLTDLNKDEFFNSYFSAVKKKDTASASVAGSLVSPEPEVPVEPEIQDITAPDTDFFEERMAMVSPELIDRGDEDEVAQELTKVFKPYGFDVEPTSIGDAIKVTAANGQTIEVDLDPWEVPGLFSVGAVMAGATTESGSSLQNFLKTGGEYDTKKEKSEAAKLKKFLRENKDESQTIAREDTAYVEPEKMFVTREQREAEVKKINKSYKEVTSLTQDYLKSERDFADKYPQFQTYDPEYIKNNPEEYQMFLADRNILEGEREFLGQMHQNTKDQGAQLDRLAGEYTEMLAERGYWSGGVFRNEFIQGAADIAAGAKDFGLDTGYNPEFLMDTDPEFFRDNYLKEAAAKGYDVPSASDMTVDEFKAWMKTDKGIPAKESIAIQNGIVDTKLKRRKRGEPIDYEEALNAYSQYATSKNMEVTGGELDALRRGLDFLKDPESTPEAADLMYESFWGGALLGVTRSLPAMLTPGGFIPRTAAMYSQISNGLEKEMAGDPEFQNISESEKFKLKLAIGSVSAALESVGFSYLLAKKSITTGLLMKLLKKSPKNITGKSFNDLVMREVDSAVGRGLLTLGSGGAIEFETGFLQEGVDIGFKSIYNEMKEKEMFETPEAGFWSWETLSSMAYAGAQEAVGGFVLGTPGAVSAARGTYDFTAIDNLTFEMFQNVSNLTAEGELTYRDMFYTNQQARINRGEISKADAQQEMDNLDEVIAVNRDIPSDLTIDQQKRSLGILLRRKDLQEQIEGKDPILVKRQQEELDGLNGELEEILYGTPEDAIQEQGPESVDAPESTRDSEAVGEGVPDIGEPTTEVEAQDDVTDEAPAPTTEVAVDEAPTEKEQKGLQRRIDRSKKDFAAATSLEEKAKVIVRYLNNVSNSKGIESEEDAAWHEANKAELEAEGFVFDDIGDELIDGKPVDIRNAETSDAIPKGKRIIRLVVKPGRVVDGKAVSQPTYDIIIGTGTTAARDALVAELEALEDELTTDNFNEISPKLKAARKALKDYDDANFPSSKSVAAPKKAAPKKTVSEPTQEVTEEERVDIDEFFGEQEIEGVEKVSENLVINRRQMTSDTRSRAKEQRTINRVKQLAIKAAVSLSKQFPDVRIVLHETPNQYKRFAGELARGSYDYNNKTVHINLTNANLQTVAHEVFHALILEKALDDPNAVILSRKMLESVKKTIDPNSEFAQKIDKFVDSYADRPIVQDEEYLAELTGMLAAQYKTLDKPAQNAIKEFFRKLAKLIGIDKKFGLDEYFGPEFLKTDAEVVDLMNTISRKIRQGVFIESSDLAVMEKIKKKSTPEELKKAREDVEKALDEQERSKREKAESGTGNRRKETAVTEKAIDNAVASRQQIVGERASLEDDVRDGLDMAMLTYTEQGDSKKVRREVKAAWGWEKGADGKWRYEIETGELKKVPNGTYKLSDVYDAPELYKAYPEAKDISLTINVRDAGAENSWFMIDENAVEINVKNYGRVRPDLIHELQHYIQFKEGFAIGGNTGTAIDLINSLPPDNLEEINTLNGKQAAMSMLSDIAEEAEIESNLTYEEFIIFYLEDLKNNDTIEEYLDNNTKDAKTLKSLYGDDAADYVLQVLEEDLNDLEGVEDLMGELYQAIQKIQEQTEIWAPFAVYERLIGEVEARNAASRDGGGRSLIEDSEDTPREDQLAVFGEQEKVLRKIEAKEEMTEQELDALDLAKLPAQEGSNKGAGLFYGPRATIANYESAKTMFADGVPAEDIEIITGWNVVEKQNGDVVYVLSRNEVESKDTIDKAIASRKDRGMAPRQQVQEKLIQRSQAASNFTDEELTAFAKEGILFHGSDMQKEFFDSKFIKEFNYGYGFYFTGVPALARKYGDKLSFVDTKEFKLLDGDEDITQEDAQDMLDNLPGYGLDNEFVEEFLQDYIDDEGFENDPQSWSMFITEYISDYESKAEIFSEYLESELGFDGMTTVENAGKGAVPTVAVVWNFDLLNDNVLQDPTKEKVIEEEAPKEVTRKEEATKDVLDFVSLVSKGTSEDVIYLNKRQQVEGINPKDVRMRSRSGNRVGKGLSVKKVNNEAVVEEIPDLTLDYVRENAPASYLKNANLIAQYPLVRGVKNFDEVSSLEQADEVYEVYARQVADNLNWIMESYPEEYREISTLWYDGANKIANELAADYGVSPEQVAGIIASLSPQNDWYQNVRAAELLLLAFRENPVMSQKMIDYQVNYAEGKINDLKKRIKSARKAKGKSQAKAKVEKFKAAEVKNLKAIADAEALLDLLRSYKGKRMEDAPDALKPYYVRLYNEVNQPKSYPIISPDGNYGSDALTDAGGKRKFGWGSYTEIGKGVSIRLDGSQENISVTLGQMHKIRNFFNNIIDPMSKEKDITMDTHAIAAALLIPASSKTKEVVQNFGTGTANSGVKGQKGLYYANQAGYFLSAEENNMLPRQVQSVTWEAVRGLFTSKFKDGAKNVKSINDIWENYAEGNITIEQARQEVLEKADGINAPSWAGLISDESRDGDGTTTERGRGKRGGPASEREGVAPRQQVVYHVTIRDNKGDIQKKGLEKDRPAMWAKGIKRADSFDTSGKSFAFSNLEDAIKWGIKTKIEKDKEVSIVAINAEGKTLQEDKAVTGDPFNPLSSAVLTEDVISPSDILSIEDVDYKFGKPFDKNGQPLTEESFDIKDDVAPRQQLSDIDGPSQRSQKGDASRIHRIISEGRDNNFTDAQILDYLVRKKFATVTQAKDLMKFPVSVVSDLPQSFRDIEGGLKVGLKLYNRVEQFIKKETDRNKRRKSPITEQQIMDLAIANLEEQAEYKAETDTQQMKMQSELQKSLGIKPTKNMAAKLRGLRKTVKERAKGARNLKVVQTELRNFIRKSLPKELYTKREVMDLIRKITAVKTSKELPNLIQEVVDFVSVKNVEALQRSIKDRLNGKYVDKSGKRIKGLKIDPDTNELLKRIREDYLVSEDATFEDIADKNTRLSKRFGELEGNPELTEAEMIEMGAIEIAMRLNNSRTMLDTDVRKAEDLGEVDDMLGEMIIGGREIMASEIRKAKAEYERQFAIAYESITGQKIDLSGTYEDDNGNIKPTDLKYYKAELEKNLRSEEMRNRRKSQESRLKKILSSLQNLFVSFVVDGASELFTLMHKIDIMPGEMFGGELQELVTERVDAATRENKARMMALDLLLKNKLKELFGKNWEKISRENAKPKVTGIIIDANAIEKAKKAYEENPSRENKQKLNDAYIDNDLVLSQNESYYLYNQYKDPANEKSFENKFGPDYERIMQEITDGIDPRVKEFADWQVNELFPTLYEQYNAVYRKIFRVNMPWNEFYAGRIYREGVEQPQQDLLPSSEGYKTAVGASSTMSRVENSKPIQTMDGTQALMSYLNDMEYFAAYSETIRDIDKIFSNKYISSSIESIYGKRTVGLINDMIKKLANKGGQNQLGDKFVNNLNNVFIFSRLGISPVIMLKQFTSTVAYANDIGYTNWVKYSAKNLSELGGIWKEVRDNSVYMQDRKFNSITKAIETYKDSDSESLMPGRTKNFFEDVLLANVKFGDRGAIYLGGLPNYSYYKAEFKKKNPKATEQEAIDYAVRRFERDTKRTQQSSDLQDKDYFQTGNPIVRQLNVFLTSPKQYFRKEIQALRNINRKIKAGDMGAGKGSLGENLRTLFTYHILMPVLFQWVAMGLPGMLRGWRDDDDEDLLRAAIIGNINAIFILGEIAVMIGDALTGKPWDATPKSVGVLQIAASITKKAKIWDKTKDPVKKEEHFKRLLWEISTLTGMPGPTLNKMAKNIEKLIEGGEDPGTVILRLFNYSDYQIEGPKNKKKGSEKSSKMSDADMKQYSPELYKMQKDMEQQLNQQLSNPELERFEKEMKLLEKQLEESLKQRRQ